MANTGKGYYKSSNAHVALDLGSDTLKIAYAFRVDDVEYTGKIVPSGDSLTALPAVAFFDPDSKKWYFAEQVTQQQNKSYLTVVKIKRLLSLLQSKGRGKDDKKQREFNAECYHKRSHFPKFYFPQDAAETTDFDALIKSQSTFVAEGHTPQSVCEAYFRHVADIVKKRVATLMKKHKVIDYTLSLSVVYPPHVGTEYVEELTRLVAEGFGSNYKINLVYSMTKALSIYASEKELLHDKQKALIFNVGEEKTFVAKTHLFGSGTKKKISIDGVEGHVSAIDLGGNDVDRAVADYLEKIMRERETIGSPSPGNPGHIYERGLLHKQYLFLQDIKSAKIIFGMYDKDYELFKGGVTINASRELIIKLQLTHDEFAQCVGVGPDGETAIQGSFADKLCDYIGMELDGYLNADVTHIFISGGVVETYGLCDVVRAYVKAIRPDIAVGTFENDLSPVYDPNGDGFEIFAHEDAVYAPAVGCAIASLNNVRVATVTSCTYGTDASGDFGDRIVFSALLDKEQDIPEKGRLAVNGYTVSSGSPAVTMFIFSVSLSRRDIDNRKFGFDKTDRVDYDSNGKLSLARLINFGSDNKRNQVYFEKMQRKIGFRQRNEDKEARITFHYRGKRVQLVEITKYGSPAKLAFDAGIRIDSLGIATPYVKNRVDYNEGKIVKIVEIAERANDRYEPVGILMRVRAEDIEFRCKPFAIPVDGRD